MPRILKALPPNADDYTFGDLVYWHLFKHGTRPEGDPNAEMGRVWEMDAVAHLLGISDRTLRNWINEKSIPDSIVPLSNLLFGSNPGYGSSRAELQRKLDQTRARRLGRAGVPPVEPSEHVDETPPEPPEAATNAREDSEPRTSFGESHDQYRQPEGDPSPTYSSGGLARVQPIPFAYSKRDGPSRSTIVAAVVIVLLVAAYAWSRGLGDAWFPGPRQSADTANTPAGPPAGTAITEPRSIPDARPLPKTEVPPSSSASGGTTPSPKSANDKPAPTSPTHRVPREPPAQQQTGATPPSDRSSAEKSSPAPADALATRDGAANKAGTTAPYFRVPREPPQKQAGATPSSDQSIPEKTAAALQQERENQRTREADAIRREDQPAAAKSADDPETYARQISAMGFAVRENQIISAGQSFGSIGTATAQDCAAACVRVNCDGFAYFRGQPRNAIEDTRTCNRYKKPLSFATDPNYTSGDRTSSGR